MNFINGWGPHFPVVARVCHLVPLICSDDTDKVLHGLVLLLNLRCFSHLLFFFVISNNKLTVYLSLALNLDLRCFSRIWLSLGLFGFRVFIETICFWTLSCDISHGRVHLLLLLPLLILLGSRLFCLTLTRLLKLWTLLSIVAIGVVSNRPCLAIGPKIGCLVGDQVHVCWLRLLLYLQRLTLLQNLLVPSALLIIWLLMLRLTCYCCLG